MTGELDAVKAGLTLSITEDFDGSALNAARWRILGEPGRNQSSTLAPVLDWLDHWGRVSASDATPNYEHNPAAVSLSNSVLRLGWSYANGVWGAGGITSANSYGAPRGTLFNTPTRGLVEFRFRAPVTPAGTGAFYAVWRLPRDDAFGQHPASGELDDFEGTQHPDGIVANPSGLNAYTNLVNDWGGVPGINFAGNSGVLTNPAVSIRDGYWHEIATHQYPEGTEEVFDSYIDGRFYHRMRVPAAFAARVQTPFVWLITAQGPGFWGLGFPADASLASLYFELDWIRHWVPVTTPPVSGKTQSAPVLEALGLSYIGQDALGTANEPADSTDFFAPHMGSRNTNTDLGRPAFNRLGIVTFQGKRCLDDKWFANQLIQLNYRTQRLPARYSEFGICVDVYYPSTFAPIPQQAGASTMHGKLALGMTVGTDLILVPGHPYGWRTEVCFPEDQHGGFLGVNWTYRYSTGNVEWGLYCHTVGGYVGGVDVQRSLANLGTNGAYSHPVPGLPGLNVTSKIVVPKGEWFEFTLRCKMDTNRRNGLIEWYVNGVRKQSWENLDLGGASVGRGLYRGKSAPAGASSASYSAGDGAMSSDCDPVYRTYGGFLVVGAGQRSMGGGYSLDPTLIPVNECHHYFYNLRWYGRA